jgi:uncharacterized damage-inducible protein DinB
MVTTRTLVRYNAWANALMFKAVAGLPPGEATKERPSLFKNMIHTLNHNYIVATIWRAHLEGRPHGLTARNTPDHPPLDELWRIQQAMDAWYIDFGASVSEVALRQPINFTLIGGAQGVMTADEILLHVVNHTTYHHGYVADMFYQVPACPPTTDLPVFLRENPAS